MIKKESRNDPFEENSNSVLIESEQNKKNLTVTIQNFLLSQKILRKTRNRVSLVVRFCLYN